MKKFLSGFLALCLVTGMSIPTFAADATDAAAIAYSPNSVAIHATDIVNVAAPTFTPDTTSAYVYSNKAYTISNIGTTGLATTAITTDTGAIAIPATANAGTITVTCTYNTAEIAAVPGTVTKSSTGGSGTLTSAIPNDADTLTAGAATFTFNGITAWVISAKSGMFENTTNATGTATGFTAGGIVVATVGATDGFAVTLTSTAAKAKVEAQTGATITTTLELTKATTPGALVPTFTATVGLKEGEDNAKAGEVAGVLSHTGGTDNVTFALKTGDGTNDADNTKFEISGTDVKIKGAALTEKAYKVFVEATDSATSPVKETLALTITVAPKSGSGGSGSALDPDFKPTNALKEGNETTAIGAVAGVLSCTGGTDPYTYAFKVDTTKGADNDNFKIEVANLKVKTSALTNRLYKVLVTATDANNVAEDLEITFTPAAADTKYTITFTTDPAEATVTVKKGAEEIQPTTGKTYALAAGEYKVTYKLQGYSIDIRDLSISVANHSDVTYKLRLIKTNGEAAISAAKLTRDAILVTPETDKSKIPVGKIGVLNDTLVTAFDTAITKAGTDLAKATTAAQVAQVVTDLNTATVALGGITGTMTSDLTYVNKLLADARALLASAVGSTEGGDDVYTNAKWVDAEIYADLDTAIKALAAAKADTANLQKLIDDTTTAMANFQTDIMFGNKPTGGSSGGGSSNSGDSNPIVGGGGAGGNTITAGQAATSTTKSVNAAISAAIKAGNENATATVSLKDVKTITPAVLKSIVAAATKAAKGKDVAVATSVVISTTKAGKVVATLAINPAQNTLATALKTGITVGNAPVQATFAKYFANTVAVVKFDQVGTFGMPVAASVKLDTTKMDTKTLKFYNYDSKTNAYSAIAAPAYSVSKDGFVTFTTTVGNNVIVTDKPLTLKK